jgi:hypothetical protein
MAMFDLLPGLAPHTQGRQFWHFISSLWKLELRLTSPSGLPQAEHLNHANIVLA